MARQTSFPASPNNNGSYRVGVGKKQFNLGTDRRKAHEQFNALTLFWDFEVPTVDGVKKWTPELIQKALATPAPVEPIQPRQISVTTPVVVTGVSPTPAPTALIGFTLYEAFDLYLTDCLARVKRNEITAARYWDVKERLDKVRGCIANFPLSELTTSQIVDDRLRNYWASRPLITKRGKKNSPSEKVPMGFNRASNLITETKTALTYIDTKTEHWIAPRNFHLSMQPPAMTKDEEKKASKAPPTFTLDEIKTLTKLCRNADQKLLVYAGIFLGWTQKELATLQRNELVEKDGEIYIDKLRSKTGIRGYWWVCPELAKVIKQRASTAPDPEDLCFRTSKGMPLVWVSDKGTRTDATGKWWQDLRRLAVAKGVRKLPYQRLRKYALQCIKNLGGHELSKVFAAQTISDSGADVNETFYTGSGVDVGVGETMFAQVQKVQRKMYEQLKDHLFPTAEEIAQRKAQDDQTSAKRQVA